jgi:hypothetical protein
MEYVNLAFFSARHRGFGRPHPPQAGTDWMRQPTIRCNLVEKVTQFLQSNLCGKRFPILHGIAKAEAAIAPMKSQFT